MKQCKACPWRVDCEPAKDIPGGYCETKHRNLKSTIAEPGALRFGPLRAMACHETTGGNERECVGWVAHQLGPGNNIALRMSALDGRYKSLKLVGEQHERFEDTLPLRLLGRTTPSRTRGAK